MKAFASGLVMVVVGVAILVLTAWLKEWAVAAVGLVERGG